MKASPIFRRSASARSCARGPSGESCLQRSRFAEGDHVVGTFGVQEYAVATGKRRHQGRSASGAAARLPRHARHAGHDRVLRSARRRQAEGGRDRWSSRGAAGAVGQVVGQIAKIKGCRVVGIAGGTTSATTWANDSASTPPSTTSTEDVQAALKQPARGHRRLLRQRRRRNPRRRAGATRHARPHRDLRRHLTVQRHATVQGPSNYMIAARQPSSMTGMVVFDHAEPLRGSREGAGAAGWQPGSSSRAKTSSRASRPFPDTLLKLFKGENTGKLVLKVAGE